MSARSGLERQYRDASNLRARLRLHQRFSTNPVGWHRWVFEALDLQPGSRILELGCGDGTLWSANADRIPQCERIVLSDFSPGMLDEARDRLRTLGPAFEYAAADAASIPFADGRFDAVIANHMLYHVPDRPQALAEIRRVLRPGGRLTASTAGVRHLQQLHELTERFAPDRDRWAWDDNFADTFTLENGEEQLRRVFRNVDLLRYDDALRVTETEPLVAYILSSRAGQALTDASLGQLREVIGAEIAARGAYQITKDAGLFAAW